MANDKRSHAPDDGDGIEYILYYINYMSIVNGKWTDELHSGRIEIVQVKLIKRTYKCDF